MSADKIGAVTIRWAGIADALARRGVAMRRDGGGRVVEVYPKASLER